MDNQVCMDHFQDNKADNQQVSRFYGSSHYPGKKKNLKWFIFYTLSLFLIY